MTIDAFRPSVPFAKDLARRLGVNSGHLRRTFRWVLCKSPSEYLIDNRIEVAKESLLGGMSVAEVASLCGYANLSSFGRAFKNEIGTSPCRYVQSHRSGV